jgi:hypothetical protein
MKSVYDQFNGALKEIRKNKIKARRNVYSCCRGCVDLKVEDSQAIIWHFGGQGNRFEVGYDAAYEVGERGQKIEGVYFNHNAIAGTENAKVVTDIFAKYGIVIEWDGSESQCIWVDFEKTAQNFQIEQAVISINKVEGALFV